MWDFNLGIGGPIAKDRVWFYANLRDEGSERTVPGMFANANAGDPTKWTYVADTSRPAVLAASYRITALRLTAQATPRNKFTVFWDQQRPCEGGAAAGFSGSACRTSGDDEVYAGSTAAPTPSASATLAPETAGYRDYGNRVSQAKWTSPVSNRLLLEAGVRHVPQPLRRRAAARSRDRESDSRRRAVRRRLRRQRQHPRADLPLAATGSRTSTGTTSGTRRRRSSPAATASSSAIRARCSSTSGRTSGTSEFMQLPHPTTAFPIRSR